MENNQKDSLRSFKKKLILANLLFSISLAITKKTDILNERYLFFLVYLLYI